MCNSSDAIHYIFDLQNDTIDEGLELLGENTKQTLEFGEL